jgi:hypothetical protein
MRSRAGAIFGIIQYYEFIIVIVAVRRGAYASHRRG